MKLRPAVLTIAGSDSGGGAGIQADLKTFAAYGVHGASAITAITAQNSRAVTEVMTLPTSIIAAQIDAVMSDLHPVAVKIGMLGSVDVVKLVAEKLDEWKPFVVVLDPVMIASSGARLLEEDATDALRDLLLPRATIVTPNWDEAGELIRAHPRGLQDLERIAVSLKRLGARNLLLKGGHLDGDEIVDTFYDGDTFRQFRNRRLEAEGHGTGCTLASAVAAGIALGQPLGDACEGAVAFVQRALQSRYASGGSLPRFLQLSSET